MNVGAFDHVHKKPKGVDGRGLLIALMYVVGLYWLGMM